MATATSVTTYQMLIGGEWVDAASGATYESMNPYTGQAWATMPETLKSRIRDHYFRHQYSHSRRKVNANLAMEKKFTHWGEQVWKAIWKNPVNGEEALYFASHTCGVVGMDDDEALALIDELMAFCTQDRFIYTHHWQHGDVLLWDERAMLHRAAPWNYAEARTLESVCLSVTDSDGFPGMRQQAAS